MKTVMATQNDSRVGNNQEENILDRDVPQPEDANFEPERLFQDP